MTRNFDARQTLPPVIEADVCIIGGGAAGLTLAVNLAGPNLKVVVLEAGDRQLEGATQELYNARQTGLRYYDLSTCRLRYFGGTTNHWGGYCRENDPIDYLGRPDLQVPAWPINYEEIAPYVARATALLKLSAREFDPAIKAQKQGIDPGLLLDKRSPDFVTKVSQISDKRLIQDTHAEALATRVNLDILFNANVTHLQLTADGNQVSLVTVKTTTGVTGIVKARKFILCTHAIENARLLLASNDVAKDGIGNEYDHVGRYFMEHAFIVSGLLYPTKRFPQLYDSQWASSRNINFNLSFSSEAMRREGILQYYCRFVPIYEHDESARAASRLKSGFWAPANIESIKALGALVGDIPNAARFVAARLMITPGEPIAYKLDHRIEQAPNPDSRVRLGPRRDALGVPEIVLNWEFGDLDYRTFARGQSLVKRQFEALGLGHVDAPDLTPELIRNEVKGHYHHIGTTRMSDAPAMGVVNRNCRVHGVGNLYVAGSSIFATAGYSGPTMMIIAFALRLAEHIKRTLGAA